MVEAQSENWGVSSDRRHVEAWSARRLQFQPRDWQVEYRDALRGALRQLQPAGGRVLRGEYQTPDQDFADLENVLLYNVGSGACGHLLATGVELRRVPSPDKWHRVSYEMTLPSARHLDDRAVLARVGTPLGIGVAAPRSAGTWWHLLRPEITVPNRGALHAGEFSVDVTLSGLRGGRTLAGQLKPLLDGLISALQVHESPATSPDAATRPQLTLLGDPDRLWDLLTNDDFAVLGSRPLVRPGKTNLVWNPSDDRCATISVTVDSDEAPHIAATVRAIPQAPVSP